MSNKTTISIIVLFAFIGILVQLFVTGLGIGTSPNSVVYIGVARNFLSVKGVTVPIGQMINALMTHHTPFYSIILGGIGLSGIDPLIVARWLNAFIFGCLILFVSLFLYQLTRKSKVTPILGSFLMLTSYPMLGIRAGAWAEQIFIFLGLLALFYLAKVLGAQPLSPLLL